MPENKTVSGIIRKMRVKESETILSINAPADYRKTIGTFPNGVTVTGKQTGTFDVVHLFVNDQSSLDKLAPKAIKSVKPGGMLWVMYPKGSSGIQTDLNRDAGWQNFMKYDLQWNHFISFDDTWTAIGIKNASKKDKVKKKDESLDRIIAKYADKVKRTVKAPPELDSMLKKNKKAADFFETLSFTNKKEYVVWILSAKQKETKAKRLNAAIEKLSKGLKNPAAK